MIEICISFYCRSRPRALPQQQRNHNDDIPRVNNRHTVIRPVQHEERIDRSLDDAYRRRVAASTDQFSTFHSDDTVLRRDHGNANIVREIKTRNSMIEPTQSHQAASTSNHQPAADYSPQPQRAFDNRPPLKSNLRSFRYN